MFREDIVRALFWTLVHSLWQGLALAILTGVGAIIFSWACSVFSWWDKKLITRTDELTVSLDKDGLTVNGQKQPDEVFQSFKKAFLDDPQDFVRYEKKGGSESTTIKTV